MEEKYRCDECGKEFSTEEGLKQHMRDKHSEMTSHDLKEQRRRERELLAKQEKEKMQRSRLAKKILVVGGAFLVLSALVYAFLILGKAENRLVDEAYLLRTNLRSHSGVSMHIHPHLKIVINGEDIEIPADIGITGGVMSVIHTHDASGTIHLESPSPKDFTVGNFFFVWSQSSGEEKIFNYTCILNYCNDGNRTVKFLVNGIESDEFENHIMRDLERIEIRYE